MDMALSKKVLNIAGIVDYITGGLTLILCVLAVALGAAGLSDPEFAQSFPATLGAAAFTTFGIYLGINALISIVTGYLSRRAVKDPTKVMPVWVISLISLVINAASVISCMAYDSTGSDMGGQIINFILAAVIFVAANSIKNSIRK